MRSKKSFLIFKDTLSVSDDLSDEQLGKLFRAIINYQLGRPNEMDFVTKLAFNSFKAQFDRDDEKWESKAEANRKNGSKGGRPKKPTITHDNPKNPDGFLKTHDNPKEPTITHDNPQKPVTVTVTGSVTDTVTETVTGSDTETDSVSEDQNNVVEQSSPVSESQPPDKTKTKKRVTKPDGLDSETWEEFKAIKKAKKQRLSPISMKTLENNAHQYGITLSECVQICAQRGWGTFKGEYMGGNLKAATGAHRGPQTIDEFLEEGRKQTERILTSGLLDDID